ncbi:MAG: hypothetical protein V4726_05840 [Verrucomicrobiota bacterium]
MKLWTLLAPFVILSAASAQEKIESAFGKKLGDAFDVKKAVGKGALTDGTPMFQFAPEKPFRSLKKYFVLVTPTTNKIYCIWAIGGAANTEAGKKEQAVIMALLEKKYGAPVKPDLSDNLYDLKKIIQGERMVMTKVTGITDVTLELRYWDFALKEVAEKERIAIEAAKAGGDGL